MACWTASLSVCLLLLLAGYSSSRPAADQPAATPKATQVGSTIASAAIDAKPASAPGTNGPTLRLDTSRGASPDNPIADFMYFVPLISPDPVATSENLGNTQQARLLTTVRHLAPEKFSATCEFEISGAGSQRNVFDPPINCAAANNGSRTAVCWCGSSTPSLSPARAADESKWRA